MERLNGEELAQLIRSVFSLSDSDKRVALLVDLPDSQTPDTERWKARRGIVWDWTGLLGDQAEALALESVSCFAYPNVHSNNADLPELAYALTRSPESLVADDLPSSGTQAAFTELLSEHQILLAPTEFSTTAPLKLMAKKYRFRAATMPGFSTEMIPALRLDYGEINRRVHAIKEKLDAATAIDIRFIIDGQEATDIHFDLRFRTAHASGGRFPEPGTAGNLPSGESYIVPYEGEKETESESAGLLPVQFGEEIVRYRIEKNKAVQVESVGSRSDEERKKIISEPAYANIAELGFGVLKDFGIQPSGSILLDEKLGLHIAFGRSDHFGGAVGVKDFTAPDRVVHIDRIYIPETQNRIQPEEVVLTMEDGTPFILMEQSVYTLF